MAEMTTDIINSVEEILSPIKFTLSFDMTVSEALSVIKEKKAVFYILYITNSKGFLIGAVKLSDLLTSPPDTLLAELKDDYSVISARFDEDPEEISQKFRDYDLLSLPITDEEGKLIGTLEYDDAISIQKQETEEDFEKMAGISAQDKPYLLTSDFNMAKSRIVWLLVLMLSSIVTGEIIVKYENAFLTVPLLIAFIPMLMGTGGNCGSQSSTIVIRSLTTEEISLSDFLYVIFKEFKIAILVSAVLAFVNGLRVFIQYGDAKLAVTITLSIIATVILAKILGASMPLIASKVGLDPAAMASPLITTIVDTCSVLVYFRIASSVFNIPI